MRKHRNTQCQGQIVIEMQAALVASDWTCFLFSMSFFLSFLNIFYKTQDLERLLFQPGASTSFLGLWRNVQCNKQFKNIRRNLPLTVQSLAESMFRGEIWKPSTSMLTKSTTETLPALTLDQSAHFCFVQSVHCQGVGKKKNKEKAKETKYKKRV